MDLYTKIILTVIAGALSIIAAQNAGVVSAVAQSNTNPMKVSVCAPDGSYCAAVGATSGGEPLIVHSR